MTISEQVDLPHVVCLSQQDEEELTTEHNFFPGEETWFQFAIFSDLYFPWGRLFCVVSKWFQCFSKCVDIFSNRSGTNNTAVREAIWQRVLLALDVFTSTVWTKSIYTAIVLRLKFHSALYYFHLTNWDRYVVSLITARATNLID